MPDATRRYSEREVARILETALDRERKGSDEGAEGLLLSEIEDIARETGISVAQVRAAVSELLEDRKRSAARRWLGSEAEFDRSTLVPGTLTKEELERLNEALPVFTSLAESKVDGDGAISWKRAFSRSLLDGFPLKLQVNQGPRGTELLSHADLRSMAAILFSAAGGLGMVLGLKISLLGMALYGLGRLGLGAGIPLLALGGFLGLGAFWLLARRLFRSYVDRSRAKVEGIMERVVDAIRSIHRDGTP